jgi:alkanesulfonate monooxygenase SsuD/methylene tetrahydromethanopterin reductase-like flavin-dependent oxidoreductase (luciferase family)/predicted MFS family arabinose efflux permease
MELGLATFADLASGVSPRQRMRELMEEVELADRLGLDVFGIGEHHRADFLVSAPAVVLGAAAVRTERIRLSSAVTVLSSADPVRVFQDFAEVDLLSNGRAEIMAGRGSFIESFPLFGYDLDDYDELYAEKLELLLKLREQTRVTWSGRHRPPLSDAGVWPRPVQEPLPVWVAVGGSPQSVVRAGTLGLPLTIAIIGGQPARFAPLVELYREAVAGAGPQRRAALDRAVRHGGRTAGARGDRPARGACARAINRLRAAGKRRRSRIVTPRQGNSMKAGGWPVIAAYALVCAATQILWLTYAAITTETARRYGVSVSAVGWLAEIFPLLYVVLAIPAGILLDRWFRPTLAAGGALVALGGLVRLGGETFAWAMAGQALVAIAQPVVLSAVSKLAGEYLPADQRADGIALGSAGNFVGMLLALLLGPTLGGHGQLERLLILEAVLAVLPAVALAVVLRRPGHESDEHAAIEGSAARALWALPSMRTLCGLVFLGFGIFVALATWLQTLLQPSHVSETAAGALLVGMVIAGIAGCAVLPPLIARRRTERGFMRAVVLVACLGCVVLGAAPWIGVRALALVAMGIVLLPALPVILTAAEQLAGAAAGTAGAIVWLAGNLGGLAIALLVQVLVHHPLAAFLAMGAVSLLGLPLAARIVSPGVEERPGAPAAATAG